MTDAFLATLNARAEALETDRLKAKTEKIKPVANVPATPKPTEITVRVELVENRNRIDLFFSAVPSDAVRKDLKARSWRWNGDRACWYNADNDLNRAYLVANFGANFDSDDSDDSSAPPAITDAVGLAQYSPKAEAPAPEIQVSDSDAGGTIGTGESAEWLRFKRQVTELQSELKIDAADLMLMAIDSLHKATFGRN